MHSLNTRLPSLGTILRILGVLSLMCLAVWYVHFQARNFLNGPHITLEGGNDVLHHEQRIPLTGRAENIVKLTLNGKEIHTDEHGDFTHLLVLERGYTVMTIEAQDRFGRTTSITKEYVYTPS